MASLAAADVLTWERALAGALYGVTCGAVTYVIVYLVYNIFPGIVSRPSTAPAEEVQNEVQTIEIGTTAYQIPSAIVAAVNAIMQKRGEGQFQTVSANALHDAGIADRRTGQAEQVINYLLEIGAINTAGERRPYQWTEAGNIAFPLPHTFAATDKVARLLQASRASRGAVAATVSGGGGGVERYNE